MKLITESGSIELAFATRCLDAARDLSDEQKFRIYGIAERAKMRAANAGKNADECDAAAALAIARVL